MDLTRLVEGLDDTTPLVRTDFSDDVAWRQVLERLARPSSVEDYEPNVAPVEDRAFTSTTGEALAEAAASIGPIGYVLLADGRSMTEAAAGTEITVAYVDLSPYAFEDAEDFNTFPGRTFRCVVDEVASIGANLSIANMDFHEFADSVEADGVFRGFPEE